MIHPEWVQWCPGCKTPMRCKGVAKSHCEAKAGYLVPRELADYIEGLQNEIILLKGSEENENVNLS